MLWLQGYRPGCLSSSLVRLMSNPLKYILPVFSVLIRTSITNFKVTGVSSDIFCGLKVAYDSEYSVKLTFRSSSITKISISKRIPHFCKVIVFIIIIIVNSFVLDMFINPYQFISLSLRFVLFSYPALP